jgi:biofilm PGA synthesis N-glycosyltransferase PgaC
VSAPLRIACVVSFLDEAPQLERFLPSVLAQTRRPDELLLVDDGSSDDSAAVAGRFADALDGARALSRPRRPPARDRLAGAPEVRSFQWAVPQLEPGWDVVVKMDADLVLSADLFETIEQAFLSDSRLGIAGTYLSVIEPLTGQRTRERCPPMHARGATKFYRRACYEQVSPLRAELGWDTVDEIAARRHGWRTAAIACPSGDTLHLRPTGAHDGRLRAQYRWGICAYSIGQHPLWVAASVGRRMWERPRLLAALAFAWGWISARLKQAPRPPSEVREFGRAEQLAELRARVRRGLELRHAGSRSA